MILGRILGGLTVGLLIVIGSFYNKNKSDIVYGELITPRNEVIKVRLAYTQKDQIQGVSGIKPSEFADNEGMLFFYKEDAVRQFWMPDTYFDLDIVYLDKDLRVIDIDIAVPHYIGRDNEDEIPRAQPTYARHVLELKSGTSIANNLNTGDILKWNFSESIEDLEKKIK